MRSRPRLRALEFSQGLQRDLVQMAFQGASFGVGVRPDQRRDEAFRRRARARMQINPHPLSTTETDKTPFFPRPLSTAN